MVNSKKNILMIFLFALAFNIFHDYFFVALEDKNVEVIMLQESSHHSDKNADIHKVLHSPYLVLSVCIMLENPYIFKEDLSSQNINLKPIQKEIFKPPIHL
jgi:hypothetical protein